MIPHYRTILYATDLTPNAAHAFRHAISLARCHNAKVYIVHILPEVDAAVVNYVATVMGEDKLAGMEISRLDEVTGQIHRRLLSFAQSELTDHPEDLERVASVEVLHGHPSAEILDAADRLDVDLVVLGSHGKGKLKYAFLGSVAEKVLRKTLRPVMIVPLGD